MQKSAQSAKIFELGQKNGSSQHNLVARESPANPPQKLVRYFDFGDVKMNGQMRERVLRAMKIRKISFAELATEALEVHTKQILSEAGAISVDSEPNQLDSSQLNT
jgi:hypothetical protein